MTCPECGFANPENARFCAGCGIELPARCSACGGTLVPGGRFCPGCGTPVAEDGAPQDATKAGPERDGSTANVPTDTPVTSRDPRPAAAGASDAEPSAAATTASGSAATDRTARRRTERRLVTILFADLAGSTALGERTDPEELAEIINGAFAVMNRAVSDVGGHIARLMGDGILAFFGAPVSHEDDPLRAVRAALAIRDGIRAYGARIAADGGPEVAVRVGLDSGLVVVGHVGSDLFSEYTTLGDAANTAARLQSAAEAGEVYVSEATAQLIRGAVELEPVGPLQLKGKSEPVPAFRVTGPPPALGVSTRGLPGVTTPLVGRRGERTRLTVLFEDAVAAGRGAWVTLTGEAGAGKTRLLGAFLDDIARGSQPATILRARAVEQNSDTYELVRDLLVTRYGQPDEQGTPATRGQIESGVAEDLAAVPGVSGERAARVLAELVLPEADGEAHDPRGRSEQALSALSTLVRALAEDQPLVLALEDLHWADDASLDAVARMAAALREVPALVVGNARPVLFQRRPLWGEGEHGHVRLDLRPLSHAATAELVAALLGHEGELPEEVIRFIAERSEGNPYYVEELVGMLRARDVLVRDSEHWRVDPARLEQGRVPTTLQGMLQAHLDALTPTEKDLLQRASVLGRVFWDGALEALGVDELERLDRLRGQGLLYARERSTFPDQREFVFRHALMRDAAYRTLLKRTRPQLHAAAAAWLLEHAGDRYSELAAQIGSHAELAGRPADAARHFLTAADRARAAYANASALSYYDRALELLPEDAVEDRYQAHRGRELVLDKQGDRSAQQSDLDAMAALAETLEDTAPSYVHFRRSWLAYRTDQNETAETEAKRALETAGDDPGAQADAYVNLGNALLNLERPDEAEDAFREALALREEMDDERGIATALVGAARGSRDAGRTDVAERDFARALTIYEQLDDLGRQAVTHTNLAVMFAVKDDLSAAEPHFRAALRLYRAAADRIGECKALYNLGFLAKTRGDLESAETQLKDALTRCRDVGYRDGEIDTLHDLAEVLTAQGRSDEADEMAETAAALAAETQPATAAAG